MQPSLCRTFQKPGYFINICQTESSAWRLTDFIRPTQGTAANSNKLTDQTMKFPSSGMIDSCSSHFYNVSLIVDTATSLSILLRKQFKFFLFTCFLLLIVVSSWTCTTFQNTSWGYLHCCNWSIAAWGRKIRPDGTAREDLLTLGCQTRGWGTGRVSPVLDEEYSLNNRKRHLFSAILCWYQ
jgi:hypothetical protein